MSTPLTVGPSLAGSPSSRGFFLGPMALRAVRFASRCRTSSISTRCICLPSKGQQGSAGQQRSQVSRGHRSAEVTGQQGSQVSRGHRSAEVTGQQGSQVSRGHRSAEVTGQQRSQVSRGHRSAEVTGQPQGSAGGQQGVSRGWYITVAKHVQNILSGEIREPKLLDFIISDTACYITLSSALTSLALALSLACSGSSVFERLLAALRSISRSVSSCRFRSSLSSSSRNLS